MTLNLMATSRYGVYLSADFRLTHLGTNNFTDNYNTQKLIPVIRFGWGALVAFTGVAAAPPLLPDTDVWIRTQMDSISMNGSFDELPQRLLEANAWLGKVTGDNRLAFSIVGFVGRRPRIMVISNFMDLDGTMTAPRARLDVAERKPMQPEVRIAGDINSVSSDEKKQLHNLIRKNANALKIRESLAEINAKAASRSKWISKECVVGHLTPSGAAEIGPHGISDQEQYLPDFVISDFVKKGVIGFKAKFDESGKQLPPRWIGMTARIQGGRGKDAVVAVLHTVRNVAGPVTDGIKRDGQTLFHRIVGPDDPKTYKFIVDKS
jgi:hypothetical protein